MRDIIKKFSLLWTMMLFALILTGCEPKTLQSQYKVSLLQVIQPKNPKEQYGTQKIATSNAQGKYDYSYEDNLLQIFWGSRIDSFGFSLKNKTKNSMKILWDEASYVDANGTSERVIHSGVKLSEMSNPQPPSVVPQGAFLTDILLPASYIEYSNYWKAFWAKPLFKPYQIEIELDAQSVSKSADAILPKRIHIEDIKQIRYSSVKAYFWGTNRYLSCFLPYEEQEKGLQDIEKEVNSQQGKRISIILPIQIEGVTNEYTFIFNIDDVYFLLPVDKNNIYHILKKS